MIENLDDARARITRILEEAAIEGILQDEDLARKHTYPSELEVKEKEKDEIADYVIEQGHEFIDALLSVGIEFPPAINSLIWRAYTHSIYNSLLAGMVWERVVRIA